MSFWSRLFGSANVVDKTVDAVISTGDKLFYTEEEKAEGRLKVLEWTLSWYEATSGSRIARRMIGVGFTITFLALVLLTSAFMAAGAFFGLKGATSAGTAILGLIGETLVLPLSIIITFYFGGPAIAGIKQK